MSSQGTAGSTVMTTSGGHGGTWRVSDRREGRRCESSPTAVVKHDVEERHRPLARELPRIVARISRFYPGLDLASIEHAVARAAGQFDRAAVHDFLPILVERRVRVELDHLREQPGRETRASKDLGRAT